MAQVKVYRVCQVNHVKSKFPEWLVIEERKQFKTSGLYWLLWQERQKNRSEIAKFATANDTKIGHFLFSKTETEKLSYV